MLMNFTKKKMKKKEIIEMLNELVRLLKDEGINSSLEETLQLNQQINVNKSQLE